MAAVGGVEVVERWEVRMWEGMGGGSSNRAGPYLSRGSRTSRRAAHTCVGSRRAGVRGGNGASPQHLYASTRATCYVIAHAQVSAGGAMSVGGALHIYPKDHKCTDSTHGSTGGICRLTSTLTPKAKNVVAIDHHRLQPPCCPPGKSFTPASERPISPGRAGARLTPVRLED